MKPDEAPRLIRLEVPAGRYSLDAGVTASLSIDKTRLLLVFCLKRISV